MSAALMNKATNTTARSLSKAASITTLLVAVASTLTGCMSFSPRSLSRMEKELVESNPDLVIVSSQKFGVGRLTMDLVDFVFVHDRQFDVSKISRADVGVYELRDAMILEDFEAPEIGAEGKCSQRDVIVRVREDDSYVDIVACIKDGRVTGISMFMLEPKEIVVINTRGDFDSIIKMMLRSSMDGDGRAREGGERRRTKEQNAVLADQDAGELLPAS